MKDSHIQHLINKTYNKRLFIRISLTILCAIFGISTTILPISLGLHIVLVIISIILFTIGIAVILEYSEESVKEEIKLEIEYKYKNFIEVEDLESLL